MFFGKESVSVSLSNKEDSKMDKPYTRMKENYEAAANSLLMRKEFLNEILRRDSRDSAYSALSMQKETLRRRIDLLTAEYSELRAALRTIEPYVLREVQA